MLVFEIINGGKTLKLIKYDIFERKELINHFKKKSILSTFSKDKRSIYYFNITTDEIAFGLWGEIYQFSKDTNISCKILNIDNYLNLKFDDVLFNDFCLWILEGLAISSPRDFQFEACVRALRFNKCTAELATSAGKTLIFYLYAAYLKAAKKISSTNKLLIIVPRTSLVSQTYNEFTKEFNNNKLKINISKLTSDKVLKPAEFNECDVLISTYQSLINKDDEFFKSFTVICCDEVHISKGKSIPLILSKSCNTKMIFGLSGTIKINTEFSEFYHILSTIGPLVMTVNAKFLIDRKISPPVKIRQVVLKYPQTEDTIRYAELKSEAGKGQFDSDKDWGLAMSNLEKSYIRSYVPRINFISKLCEIIPTNTLILFNDIKGNYGKTLYNTVAAYNANTFYIDGSVDVGFRENYQTIMEKNNDVRLFASFGTFSTGISVKNIHNIILAESCKSEIIIRQSIGRGMRFLLGKYQLYIYDIVDNIIGETGYSMKHAKHRTSIYNSQFFKIEIIHKDL